MCSRMYVIAVKYGNQDTNLATFTGFIQDTTRLTREDIDSAHNDTTVAFSTYVIAA